MKALVTGGGGFLGGAIAKQWLISVWNGPRGAALHDRYLICSNVDDRMDQLCAELEDPNDGAELARAMTSDLTLEAKPALACRCTFLYSDRRRKGRGANAPSPLAWR